MRASRTCWVWWPNAEWHLLRRFVVFCLLRVLSAVLRCSVCFLLLLVLCVLYGSVSCFSLHFCCRNEACFSVKHWWWRAHSCVWLCCWCRHSFVGFAHCQYLTELLFFVSFCMCADEPYYRTSYDMNLGWLQPVYADSVMTRALSPLCEERAHHAFSDMKKKKKERKRTAP